MPIDFPANPTNGQYHAGYIWNDASGVWDSAYAPRPATIPLAGYNAIINGGMDIWQRGTSTTNNTGYLADRWRLTVAGTGYQPNQSRVAAPFAANVPYALRGEQAGITATSLAEYAARTTVERSNVESFAGKSVVLSFWYRSNKVGTHGVRLVGVGTGAGDWTTSFTVSTANTWEKYSVTSSVPFGSITSYGSTAPTDAGAYVDIGFKVGNSGPGFTSLSAGDYFELTGVQLEEGYAATDFRRNAPSIQGELAACQRYYYQASGQNHFGALIATNDTGRYTTVFLPTSMRSAITSGDVVMTSGSGTAICDKGTMNSFSVYWNVGAITSWVYLTSWSVNKEL